MTSIGGFREQEIDGKLFLVFNFSSEAAIDSGGEDVTLQHLFLCPSIRLKVHELQRKEKGYTRREVFPMNVSPHFPSIQGADQLLDSDSHDDICKLPVLPLFWCNNEESVDSSEFRCGACQTSKLGIGYYFCVTCCEMFHKECVESPLEIKHPSHPSHPFQLSSSFKGTLKCICCETSIYRMIYHSPTNNLSMHPVCAMKSIPLVIDHPKRHPHPLLFYPRQSSLVCNVCSVIKDLIPTYVCVRCNYAVHQDCIYFPHVINISRHDHRIFFISSVPFGKWSCGVCRQNVDNGYGAYSCNKCPNYFVHSRCALRRDVWDGEELEGVSEESDDDYVGPFEMIADGIIVHFSHEHHHLRLQHIVYDEKKLCQACILPIYEGDYYSCMDCDFTLHEECACAPRMYDNDLHPHPLELKVRYGDGGQFRCDACQREGCGFVYECSTEECEFRLDVRCSLISEPFKYPGHEHPLYLDLEPGEDTSEICQICQEEGAEDNHQRKLNCDICHYVICFKCATLPYKARHEDDKHYLKFCEGKEVGDCSDWCEVCERKIVGSTKECFYRCNDCCNTLHINCLLGEDPYMKPDQTIIYHGMELHILRNNIQLRPFCCCCEQRCPQRVIFQKNNEVFCSLRCVVNSGG